MEQEPEGFQAVGPEVVEDESVPQKPSSPAIANSGKRVRVDPEMAKRGVPEVREPRQFQAPGTEVRK